MTGDRTGLNAGEDWVSESDLRARVTELTETCVGLARWLLEKEHAHREHVYALADDKVKLFAQVGELEKALAEERVAHFETIASKTKLALSLADVKRVHRQHSADVSAQYTKALDDAGIPKKSENGTWLWLDERIAKVGEMIAWLREQVSNRDRALEELRAHRNNLNEALAAKAGRIAELTASLAERAARIEQRDARIEELEVLVNDLRAKLTDQSAPQQPERETFHIGDRVSTEYPSGAVRFGTVEEFVYAPADQGGISCRVHMENSDGDDAHLVLTRSLDKWRRA